MSCDQSLRMRRPSVFSLPRRIDIDADGGIQSSSGFCNNIVRTSRYTLVTFLPINLFEQFMQPANFFFLLVGLMQSIPAVSTTRGIPTIALPLAVVLFVSGVRAAVEDYRRHQADDEQINKLYEIRQNGSYKQCTSGSIQVGHIIRIHCGQEFPADIIMLHSSKPRGHCFVETSSLDGETSLKVKSSVMTVHAKKAVFERMRLEVEHPHMDLEMFRGILVQDHGVSIEMSGSNILLRGTILSNTDSVVGVVAYTGNDTKIRCNSCHLAPMRIRISSLSKRVNKLMMRLFALQIALCLFASGYSQIWINNHGTHFYLDLQHEDNKLEGISRFFTYFILMAQIVPISYLVSAEMIKTMQAYFIMHDAEIRNAKVKTSALNEELGQIGIIVTDKTGTLTENRLNVRIAIVGDAHSSFGSGDTEIGNRIKSRRASEGYLAVTNSCWTDLLSRLCLAKMQGKNPAAEFDGQVPLMEACQQLPSVDLRRLLVHCAISNTNTPMVDETTHRVSFQASSPDEHALCEFAHDMNFSLVSLHPTTVQAGGETIIHTRLAALEFNSKRKRVSMVYQRDDQIVVMCKGADSVVLPLLKAQPVKLPQVITGLATRGLRTLVFAEAVLPKEWWEKWRVQWEHCMHLPEVDQEVKHSRGGCLPDCRICLCASQIETDAELKLVGAVGLEDSLQALVPESIDQFARAGIKLVMLTGDKSETAESIAIAANLIDPESPLIRFDEFSTIKDALGAATQAFDDCKNQPKVQASILIEGVMLSKLLGSDFNDIDKLLELSSRKNCKSLVCARSTPSQKAQVVSHLKRFHKRNYGAILAVGDGANDEEMIIAADVGIGIAGLEGGAAARAADFSVENFCALHTLLFVHGVWNYSRMAKLTYFIFYKSAIIPFAMILFGTVSAFSGQQLFPEVLNAINNVFFTGLPVLMIGIFDRILDREIMQNNAPYIYYSIQRGALFNGVTFSSWIASAGIDAIIVFVFVFYPIHLNLVTASVMAFTSIFFLVTIRALSLMSSVDNISLGSVLLSMIVYICLVVAFDHISIFQMEGTLGIIFSCPTYALHIVLGVALPCIFAFSMSSVSYLWNPTPLELIRRVLISGTRAANADTIRSKNIGNIAQVSGSI